MVGIIDYIIFNKINLIEIYWKFCICVCKIWRDIIGYKSYIYGKDLEDKIDINLLIVKYYLIKELFGLD